MRGGTIWFTGLACSGKTTLANSIKDRLAKDNINAIILDSDKLRAGISKDFGYTQEEREKHMQLVAHISSLLTKQGALNIAAVISPTKSSRENARNTIKNFIEVYVKCPLAICKKRDVKGHYKDFEEGKKKFCRYRCAL